MKRVFNYGYKIMKTDTDVVTREGNGTLGIEPQEGKGDKFTFEAAQSLLVEATHSLKQEIDVKDDEVVIYTFFSEVVYDHE